MSSEVSDQTRVSWVFIAFSVATFISFVGTSSISYFSVMLADSGMSKATIGWVLSSALLSTVPGILLCGGLLSRFSALQLAVMGQGISLLAYASFIVTFSHPLLAALSRFMVGAGFGLFFPAALLYARTLISGPNAVFLFGLYSTMIPLPNLIGPGLAEAIYQRAGIQPVLWTFTACVAVGWGLSLLLPAMPKSERVAAPLSYWRILFNKQALLPHLAIVTVGLLWGFMLSFIALYLHATGISATIFFSTATLAMVASRFTIMAWLGRHSRYLVSGLGLLLMSGGYIILPWAPDEVAVVFSAALIFGLGYSFAFPVLSLWATDHYPQAQRGRPMAIFTALFQGGIFAIPLLAGVFSEALSLDVILHLLAVVSGVLALLVFVRGVMHRNKNAL